MSGAVIEIIQTKGKEDKAPVVVGRAVYEHPYIVRLCHWMNTVALFVMVGSGLQIFRAFPSFGAKIPQKDLLHWPKAFAIGGWLGGALQWHLTFMWIYIATGVLYLGYQIFSGNYQQVLFTHRDIPGVWPMVKHYFFFGPKPPLREAYNPLQKQAYTIGDRAGRFVCADRFRGVEADSVLLAGLDDGRLSLRAHLAFRGDVGDFVFRAGTSGHGDPARLEQFRFHADGMEERSRVLSFFAMKKALLLAFGWRSAFSLRLHSAFIGL